MDETSKEVLLRMSLQHARSELIAMLGKQSSPFISNGERGLKRGVDFYSASKLLHVMAMASAHFYSIHGAFPRIAAPVGFNEWVTWRKFFDSFKIPESGNKLLTSKSIPSEISGSVRCANVLWRSVDPKLPDNDDLPPGRYFLKASHGAGLYEVISYPLQPADRTALERTTTNWLSYRYGLPSGEWWYSAFKPEVFIEEYLGDDRISINFFCFRGKTALIVLHSKWTKETITLMPDFSVVGQKNGATDVQQLCSHTQLQELCELASNISSSYTFVRVDFLVAENGGPILGELTFTPGNGLSIRPPGIDEYLGRIWAKAYD
jgi:hypothetical protein